VQHVASHVSPNQSIQPAPCTSEASRSGLPNSGSASWETAMLLEPKCKRCAGHPRKQGSEPETGAQFPFTENRQPLPLVLPGPAASLPVA
jgi:hypothetical protein